MFDAHCHLDDPHIDVEAALSAVDAAGITGAVIAGYGPERLVAGRALCRRDPRLRLAAGLHPWWFAGRDDAQQEQGWAALERAATDPDIVAIGELGLDRGRRPRAPAEVQRTRMERALDIAARAEKPVILHVVGWHGHALSALDAVPITGGLVHRFGGSDEVLAGYLRRGLHISLDVIAFRRRPQALLATASRVPLERLLLETDWPERGRSYAESLADLALLYLRVAAIRGVTVATVVEALVANNRRLYA